VRELSRELSLWYHLSDKAVTARGTFPLFVVVGEAALFITAVYFLIVRFAIKAFLASGVPPAAREIVGILGLFLPIAAASWWMFRRLLDHYARPEAHAAAKTFGFFAIVPVATGLVLGQIVGGFTGTLLGDRFAFAGAVAGFALIVTLMSFAASAIAIGLVRLEKRVADHSTPPNDS